MTEESEDNCLVRVRAQVMTRDDSSGGWIPLSGGGLANVCVRKRVIPSNGHQCNATNGTGNQCHSLISNDGCSSNSPPTSLKRNYEYCIYGKRTSDQSIVLSCTIKKDFEYNKVMPTFHHWRVGEKKFGLTFHTAADGRAFDEGVRRAVRELLQGLTDVTLHGNITDGGDDDVFMTLNLPVDASDTRPPEVVRTPNYQSGYPDFQDSQKYPPEVVRTPNYQSGYSDCPGPQKRIHYIDESTVKPPSAQDPLGSNIDAGSDNYPYVHLAYVSIIGDHKGDRLDSRDTEDCFKKSGIMTDQTQNPKAATKQRNVRCRHCQELYTEQQNPRGSCKYAPDPVKRGISTITCLPCAQCMLYHCMSDAEGDFTQDPCSCTVEDGCGRKWFGLTLLSLIVPCLWIYPPLRAVHRCGMSCGICGGRHQPIE